MLHIRIRRRNKINVAKIKRKPDASDSLRHSPQTSAAILYYIMPHFFRLYNKDYMINYRIKCYISNTCLCTDTFSNSKFLVDKHLVI